MLFSLLGQGSVFMTSPARAVNFIPTSNNRMKDFAIIRKDATWHIFAIYCDLTVNCDPLRRGLMHLTSVDLKNWTEVGYVLAPDGGTDFDDYDVWAPSIVERNGTYYMYYTGVYKNGSNTYVQKIGLATSTDLTTWTKYSTTTPVFDCTALSGVYYNPANNSDGAACRDPHVTWDENEHQWVMSVSSRRTGSTPANNMSIALATSEDLVTWNPYGFIPATDDYTSESSHIFTHAGTYYMVFTEDGSGAKWIDYLTSTNLYTGWTRIGDLTPVAQYEYASEYITDHGKEYFVRIDHNNVGINIHEIVWSGTPFSFQDVPYGTIGDAVWSDTDGDGVYDAGEAGIDNVAVTLYLDNGDGLFNSASDSAYATATSGDDPNTIGTQHGYYRFSDVIPSTYWVVINPSNDTGGGALENMVATTSATVAVTLTDSQAYVTADVGYKTVGNAWSLSTVSNFTVNSEATLTGGRATSALTAGTPGWWNDAWLYRRQVTVTAGSEALDTTYTANLGYDFGALVTAGKLQASYNDARLVYWNGSSYVELDLDVIDSTTERFKVQAAVSASGSDANYYLYYGNSNSAKRPTRFAGVYDYFASFNAADGSTYNSWQQSTASWVITGNRWKFNSAQTAADRFSRDPSKVLNLADDWNLEVSATVNSGGQVAMPVFHSQQAFGNEQYQMNFDAVQDFLQPFHWAWGNGNLLPKTGAATINTGTEYRMRFRYDYISAASRHLYGYLDNVLKLDSTETQSGGDLPYDIWYQASCPCADKNATPALGVYNSQSSFNDLKGWQDADGLAVAVNSTEVARFPVRSGTVQPISGQALPFGSLTSFTAATLEQGGTVRFILSNDGGATWYYHTGSAWAVSNGTSAQANTAGAIATAASSFPVGSGSLLWRAILSATSSSFPTLLQVGATVNHAPIAPSSAAFTPTNGSSLSTFQPTLTFSTTDSDGDALQYQLQIDTVNTFASPQLQTITQSSSQAGWSGQDALSATGYLSGTVATYTMPSALPNGTYYWRVRAIDPNGTVSYGAYSSAASFTTPAALALSSISVNHATTTATVSWTSNHAGSSGAEYGTTSGYGSTGTSAGTTTSHQVALSGLTAGTTYHYRVTTVDGYGQSAQSSDATFATDALPVVTVPDTIAPSVTTTVSNVTVTRISPSSATVTWTTNEAATSIVRYGTTTGYGSIVRDSEGMTSHTVLLRSLAAARTYHFQVESQGSSVAQSADGTFRTLAATSTRNRAIAPTILSVVPSQGAHPKVTVRGIAVGGQTLRLYIDGKVVQTRRTSVPSTRIRSFTFVASVASYRSGKHTLYVQSEDSAGRTSLIRQRPTFTIGAKGGGSIVVVQGIASKHTVIRGESLWLIAQRFMGNARSFLTLAEANFLNFPTLKIPPRMLQPGWILDVPAR